MMPEIRVFPDSSEMAAAAAADASVALQKAIREFGRARVVAATGASQLQFLAALTQDRSVAWDRVELFHLDEYVGLDSTHLASFAKYIRERIIEPTGIRDYYLLNGALPSDQIISEASRRIAAEPIHVAFVGIGENGHLAFNDPPADFVTTAPYLVVNLDEACRRQQVGEGWFGGIDEVPTQAISMSVQQILKAHQILCVVPDERKARAVAETLGGPITPDVPASILRTHPNVTLYLDDAAASLLKQQQGGAVSGNRETPRGL
jgi:glucosamine-6-phosphate deaminase